MFPDPKMNDTSSSSSSSESDHEEEEENTSRLSWELQETPSLAEEVKDCLSLKEAGEAAGISDMPIGVGVFISGALGKNGRREPFRASANKIQRSARIRRKDIEKEMTRKRIWEARQRKTFKRATIIASSEDEEKGETRGATLCKRWNMISSDENEEEPTRKAGSSYPDNENNSVKAGPGPHWRTACKYIGTQEASARGGVFFVGENTTPSSSLGPSPPNSPQAEWYVQKASALNYIQERRKNNLRRSREAQKRKEEMLLRLLDVRRKRCKEKAEGELLRMAAHLMQCNGCDDTRYSEESFFKKGLLLCI